MAELLVRPRGSRQRVGIMVAVVVGLAVASLGGPSLSSAESSPVAAVAAAPEPFWPLPPMQLPRWSAAPASQPGEQRSAMAVNGSPGAAPVDQLRVVNRQLVDLTVEIAPAVVRSVDGVLKFEPFERPVPGVVTNAGYWLDLPGAAERLVVSAGTTVDVPVRVVVPEGATVGEQLAAVVVTETATQERHEVPIRVRVDGPLRTALTITESSVEVGRLGWSPFGRVSATVAFRAENTGSTIVQGPMLLRLDTAFDRKVLVADLGEVVLPPGAVVERSASTTAWPTLFLRPELAVDVTASIGGDERRTVTVGALGDSVAVVPWQSIAVAGAMLLVVLSVWVVARSRARRSLPEVTP